MRTPHRYFVASLSILLLCSVGCHKHHPMLGLGDDWLSMSRGEKQLYVGGFLDGSANQAHVLCQNIESEPDNRIRPAKSSDGSVDPCLSFRSSYSHVNLGLRPDLKSVDPYVSIIDDFYSHPECRPMPYFAILEHLDDSEFLNGEELYHFVRSGSAAWGSFTGFDGIDDCYGADRKR